MNQLAKFIATAAYVGNIPKAPGTFGSLFGIALFAYIWDGVFMQLGLLATLSTMSIITLVIYLTGVWATRTYMAQTGQHDPKEVVIDEVAGIFVMMLVVIPFFSSFTPITLAILFALFRLFDIAKPSLIGTIDRTMAGAHGVMLDDVIAGIYAAVVFVIGITLWTAFI